MAFTYTQDQKKVIFTEGRSILVSAAAGSGKTAVLVERIIRKITNKDQLVSIDQLLIVTFTKAAASEMRERIGKGIEEALEAESDPVILEHLISQLTLLPAANIMTMHSFCLKIIKSYYHLIDLDPTFRIGNETELVLLKEEIMDELLEDRYEEGSESFLALVESFASGKNDNKIKEIIFRTYSFAMSNPWPLKWLDDSYELLQIESVEEFLNSEYYQMIVKHVRTGLISLNTFFEELEELMNMDQGPDKYKDTVSALKDWLLYSIHQLEEKDYLAVVKYAEQVSIPALSRKSKGYDKELAARAKDLINDIKKNMASVLDLRYDPDHILDEISIIRSLVGEIVSLTKAFKEAYESEKETKAIIDFNDIEHFALKLLYTGKEASEIAAIYKDQFAEVLVDEYQDTNEVQEAILKSLSKENNLFMVGDLKQSIYKFRLAKPEIFKQKYNTFDYEDSLHIKIDLAKNFRSRSHVLNMTNHIFESIMSKELGDVDYDQHAKLNMGAVDYQEGSDHDDDFIPEIIIGEKEDDKTKEELQSEMVASKIKQLLSDPDMEIFDKDEKIFRRPKYSDICVLMRSPSTTIQTLKQLMEEEQIPYEADVTSGFFDAVEVQVIMSMLKIIDNPFQDIPLTSVLRSPLAGLTENELLLIREYDEGVSFQEAFWSFASDQTALGDDLLEPLVLKVNQFTELYESFRQRAKRLSLEELLDHIYKETGYYFYTGLMENGPQRMNNLDYLRLQAKNFENSSYKGLFNFIRYVDHIKKYEIEIPEPLIGKKDSGVAIMSIHRSKGLEYPIVIIMNIHKEFNMMDLREGFMLHQEMGFACDYYDYKRRFRMESPFSKAIRIKSREELLSEELRLLYVGLTRAREKLILTGVVNKLDKFEDRLMDNLGWVGKVDLNRVKRAKSYLDWLLMTCPQKADWVKWDIYSKESTIALMKEYSKEVKEVNQLKVDMLSHALVMDRSIDYLQVLNEPYHHENQIGKYVTMSVSELKEAEQREKFNDSSYVGKDLKETMILEKPIPDFIQKKDQSLKGSAYGLVMHKILSLLPAKAGYTFEVLKNFVEELIDQSIIEEVYRDKIYIKPILDFTKQSIYGEIIEAGKRGELYKEQPFVLGIDDHGDHRMIQGVIDLFYEKDGKLILLDYKTDYIEDKQADMLLDRYKIQLDYYSQALSDITGKEVSHKYIYSLSLGRLLEYES